MAAGLGCGSHGTFASVVSLSGPSPASLAAVICTFTVAPLGRPVWVGVIFVARHHVAEFGVGAHYLQPHAVTLGAAGVGPIHVERAGHGGRHHHALDAFGGVGVAGHVQAKGLPARVVGREQLAQFRHRVAQAGAQRGLGGVAGEFLGANVGLFFGVGGAGVGKRLEEGVGLGGGDTLVGQLVGGRGGEVGLELGQ